ncbi:hypothetical protein [Loigolactobacillus coryniformis]|uniref:Uncharacterized protein n=1 Tax=Loigolactobacillus coryniformis subsp. torquens DSM 20004 = KCTC 3535 TaxID=1423822 RepID=A0A2D1KK09_9LACO|nr:hypothetical protein [Loigolactobacillus coryniformis]ATO42455.1 hypothetical protein LC20004_00310 [Loigolactobacillus coryniformis subsp. torquens DSM 20004 = KCTC 3535]KRK84250.1 hypothetical protein FC16_GL001601 [Loigolactobacillus coryniformis subsp. torquens DSM 20004 = KCTC 3535]
MKFKQQTIIVLAGVLLFLNQTTLASASTGSSATSNTAVAIKAQSATGLDTAAFSAALQAKLTAKLAAATDQVAVNFVARTAASATARPLYQQARLLPLSSSKLTTKNADKLAKQIYKQLKATDQLSLIDQATSLELTVTTSGTKFAFNGIMVDSATLDFDPSTYQDNTNLE